MDAKNSNTMDNTLKLSEVKEKRSSKILITLNSRLHKEFADLQWKFSTANLAKTRAKNSKKTE
jgi:hypothetical protein